MEEKFKIKPIFTSAEQAINHIIACNHITEAFGLILTEEEAKELVETRTQSLKSFGRVEFSGGIIDKLIKEFCDSPYISQYNYAETLNELIEIFYYFKNESLDEISDDDLISLMRRYYDEECLGDIELLKSKELENIARSIRYGEADYESNERETFNQTFLNEIYYEGEDE